MFSELILALCLLRFGSSMLDFDAKLKVSERVESKRQDYANQMLLVAVRAWLASRHPPPEHEGNPAWPKATKVARTLMMHTIVGQNKVSDLDFIAKTAKLGAKQLSRQGTSSSADRGDLVVSNLQFENPLLTISRDFVSRDFSNDDAQQQPVNQLANRIVESKGKSGDGDTDRLAAAD